MKRNKCLNTVEIAAVFKKIKHTGDIQGKEKQPAQSHAMEVKLEDALLQLTYLI